jgi:hypothetical protein
MKELTLSVVVILAIALGFGLVFRWIYPRVDLTPELAGLFVFVAVALKLVVSKLWSRRKPRLETDK